MGLTIGGREIILDKSTPISLSLGLVDFSGAPGEQINSISYTINVPYELNARTLNFVADVNSPQGLKNRCGLLEAEIDEGGLCLRGTINFIDTNVSYVGDKTVTIVQGQFVAGFSDFFRMCPTRLCDLELGQFTLSREFIVQTIADSSPYNGTNPIWFPTLNLGNSIASFENGENELATPYECLNPTIHDKAILDAILKACGLTLCSDFLNSEAFTRDIKTFGNECKYSAHVLDVVLQSPQTISGSIPVSLRPPIDPNALTGRIETDFLRDDILGFTGFRIVDIDGDTDSCLKICINVTALDPNTQLLVINENSEVLESQTLVLGENIIKYDLESELYDVIIQGSIDADKFDIVVLRDNVELRENVTYDIGRSLSCEKSPEDLIRGWTKLHNLNWVFDPFTKCLDASPKRNSSLTREVEVVDSCDFVDSIIIDIDNTNSPLISSIGNLDLTIEGPPNPELESFFSKCNASGDTINLENFAVNQGGQFVIANRTIIRGGTLTITQNANNTNYNITGAVNNGCISEFLQPINGFYVDNSIEQLRIGCWRETTRLEDQTLNIRGFYNGCDDWTSKRIKSTLQEQFNIDGINRNLIFSYCELAGQADTFTEVLCDAYPDAETPVSLDCFSSISSAPYTVYLKGARVQEEGELDRFIATVASQEDIDTSIEAEANADPAWNGTQRFEAGIDTFPFVIIDDSIPTLFEEPNQKLCTDKMISLTKIGPRPGQWFLRNTLNFRGEDQALPQYGYSEFTKPWSELVPTYYGRDIELYNNGVMQTAEFLLDITDVADFKSLFQKLKYYEDSITGNGQFILDRLDIENIRADKLVVSARLIGDGK